MDQGPPLKIDDYDVRLPVALFLFVTHPQFARDHFQVSIDSSFNDATDGVIIDIGPRSRGNNPFGTNDGTGYPVNPVTGEPYEPVYAYRGDYTRCLAEFWADGPHSETPPGHWNTILNYVNDQPQTSRRIGGQGDELGMLDWDVLGYFALNGAVHDAAVAAWSIKGHYDSMRPVGAIRYMCEAGQRSDPSLPRYHPHGAVLIPGFVEINVDNKFAGFPENTIMVSLPLPLHSSALLIVRCTPGSVLTVYLKLVPLALAGSSAAIGSLTNAPTSSHLPLPATFPATVPLAVPQLRSLPPSPAPLTSLAELERSTC